MLDVPLLRFLESVVPFAEFLGRARDRSLLPRRCSEAVQRMFRAVGRRSPLRIPIRMTARGGRQQASVESRLSQGFGHLRQWYQRREAFARIAPRSGALGVSRRRTCGGHRRP